MQERYTSPILLTRWGDYKLADNAYDELLEELQEQQYKNVTPQLKKSILDFYSTADSTALSKKALKKWPENSLRIKEISAYKPIKQDTLKSLVLSE